MAERSQLGRFKKANTLSRANNFINFKDSLSDPPTSDHNEEADSEMPSVHVEVLVNLDHTYTLPLVLDNDPLEIFSEIEVHTEVNKGENIENELLFDYIPSDLVPLSHCRFIVDLGFVAEQLKHCQSCQSTLHLYNALGVKPLGFSGLMYVQCPECGGVTKIKLGKTHHSGNSKRGCGTFDINTKAATGALFI